MTLTSQQKQLLFHGLTWSAIFALLGGVFYLNYLNNSKDDRITVLLKDRAELLSQSASTTRLLKAERETASSTIHELSSRLYLTQNELEDIERNLKHEKNRNEEFEDQLNDLAGTVEVLDKLSKTDEELLQKYSRTYFLNENFIPMKLTLIDSKYLLNSGKDYYFHGDAVEFLEDMLTNAKKAGHDIRVASAFRSFDEQREVKAGHSIVYGSGANAFSADQGYSEHQLGTAADIVDVETSTLTQSFGDTEAFAWLKDNAHRYGFILSYPPGNQFYIYEPWHWRFVGRSLATDLYEENRSFYDLDQRELDAYLIKIFD